MINWMCFLFKVTRINSGKMIYVMYVGIRTIKAVGVRGGLSACL
tara:strand:+ start:480 stop:611 length:132 start_codon:yes stop_codon:yes gene_type:complete